MKKIFLLVALCLAVFCSCNRKNIILEFTPITEHSNTEMVEYEVNLENGVFSGLELPFNDSVFTFSVSIDNPNNNKLYYKIYYKNTSYAFEDNHPLSHENFYGSWENTSTTFKECKSQEISDTFRIVGNPRNEKKYFGKEFPEKITPKDIKNAQKPIFNNPEWLANVEQKAKENQRTLEEQLYCEALWLIKANREGEGDENHRERRNPRMGIYEFMIVVCDSTALEEIPDYVKNISLTKDDGTFENPFNYFLYGKGKKINGVYTLVAKQRLKAKARFNLSKGVYVNRENFPGSSFNIYKDNSKVGDDDSLYLYAQFEEYYHSINTNRWIDQIESIEDLNELSLDKYKKNKLIQKRKVHPFITDYPGKNIKVGKDFIEMINPGSKDLTDARKVSTGIRSRIGFTYGKFRAKVKFPPLLNKYKVWNGLTNAFWLIYQSDSPWNERRESKTGFVKNNYNEQESERVNKTNYSEIDIEMVKTSKYWGVEEEEFDKNYNPQNNNNFIFAATNWDLACNDNGFIDKALHFSKKYDKNTFTYHRWDRNYRALTSRVEVSNDIFLAPYYYYEIEWTPTEIIWRIGPDEKHMQVVGYMNETFTTIPNNQMLPIFTQEFHYSEFWPPIIFEQGLIPYSKEDLRGRIYELTIE